MVCITIYSNHGFPSPNSSHIYTSSPPTQLHTFFLSLKKQIDKQTKKTKLKNEKTQETNTHTQKNPTNKQILILLKTQSWEP